MEQDIEAEAEDTPEEVEAQEEDVEELPWNNEMPNPDRVGTNIPEYEEPQWTEEQINIMEQCNTAFDWYQIFSPPEWMQRIVDESQNYNVSQGRNDRELQHLTINNLR